MIEKLSKLCSGSTKLLLKKYGKLQAASPIIWNLPDQDHFISNYEKNIASGRASFFKLSSENEVIAFFSYQVVSPPGVYNPGPTCMVDEFIISEEVDHGAVSKQILAAINSETTGQNLAQFVINLPHSELSGQNAIADIDMQNCSVWWTGEITPKSDHKVSYFQNSDIEHAVRLSHEKRSDYESQQPVFWKMASDADEIQSGYFESMVADLENSMRAEYHPMKHESDGQVTGIIIGQLKNMPPFAGGQKFCHVDDFVVTEHNSASKPWETTGKALLEHLAHQINQGLPFSVVSGLHDKKKSEFLSEIGLTPTYGWWVKPCDENGKLPLGDVIQDEDFNC